MDCCGIFTLGEVQEDIGRGPTPCSFGVKRFVEHLRFEHEILTVQGFVGLVSRDLIQKCDFGGYLKVSLFTLQNNDKISNRTTCSGAELVLLRLETISCGYTKPNPGTDQKNRDDSYNQELFKSGEDRLCGNQLVDVWLNRITIRTI